MGVMRRLKTMRPTAWITVERVFSEFFFFALFAIQAPILGPQAFGLLAAVMVIVAFWEGVLGHAMIEALMSVRDIDSKHYSSVTAAATIVCAGLAALTFLGAHQLAPVLENAESGDILRVMSVLPLLQALSIAPLAAAQRDLQFRVTTLRTIVGLFAGGAVGLALALTGAGVWALVWQAVVQRFVTAFVLWYMVPIRFSLAYSSRHLRGVGHFALPILFSRVMGWTAGQLPRLILGIFLGATELGLFTLASRLHAIVLQVAISPRATVGRVSLQRVADAPQALAADVQKMFFQLSLVSYPACLGGAAIVPTLFRAWLDQRWEGAILPTQLLLLATAPYVTFYGATALLYAINKQRCEAVIATVLSLGGVLSVVVGAPFGIVTTSALIATVTLVTLPLPVVMIHRVCGLSVRDVLQPQVPALVAAAGSALGALLMGHLVVEAAPFVRLALQVGAGTLCYGVVLFLVEPALARRVLHFLRHPATQA